MSRIEDEISRGNKAAEVLRNPVFDEAFHALHAHYYNAWKHTATDDVDTRERLFVAINVLDDIRTNIESVMNTGKLAGEEGGGAVH